MRASVSRPSASWRTRPGARIATAHACAAEFADGNVVTDAKTLELGGQVTTAGEGATCLVYINMDEAPRG